jgi:hypothetical protein
MFVILHVRNFNIIRFLLGWTERGRDCPTADRGGGGDVRQDLVPNTDGSPSLVN